MSSGLKNLQSASRACSRRERLESGSGSLEDHHSGAYGDPHTDDSGIGLGDDLEAEYSPVNGSFDSSPERTYAGGGSERAGYANSSVERAYGGHSRHMSDGRSSYGGDGGSMRGDSMGRSYAQSGNIMHNNGMAPRPSYGMQQRLPSIDMGVGAILNRGPNGV
jgi:hypothetical protein